MKKKESQEALVIEFQTLGIDHASHLGVVNPTPLQVRSPNSFLDHNLGIRIKTTLRISIHTRNNVEKWLCFLKERKISKPQVNLETMVLTNSKDKDNLMNFL